MSPVLKERETEEKAVERIVGVAEHSRPVITLKMCAPEEAKLRWEEIDV